MAWNVDDVIAIELKQDYIEQSIVNILFYKIVDIVGGIILNELLDLLAETIVDFITPAQNDELDHVEQIINNLTDEISQHLATYSASGAASATNLAASFLAVGLKKGVSSRITRPGAIRIAGLNEGNFVGNELEAGYISTVNGVAVDLGSTLIINDGEGTVATFNPVIVGRNPDGSFDTSRINDVTSFGLPRLTTQSSRKPER